jgi:hypothetical protein
MGNSESASAGVGFQKDSLRLSLPLTTIFSSVQGYQPAHSLASVSHQAVIVRRSMDVPQPRPRAGAFCTWAAVNYHARLIGLARTPS